VPVTEQLEKFMKLNGYKISDIARLSNVPYTTIDGLFKKGADNIKLSTLRKLANLLQCSLDELVGMPQAGVGFTIEERLFLLKFRSLDECNKKALLVSVDVLLDAQKERKKA